MGKTVMGKVKALFGSDKGVAIEFDEAECRITLRVANVRKANAISRLVPPEVKFGNVTLKVCVVPGNVGEPLPKDAATTDVVAAAFDGNPVVTQVRQVSKGMFRDLAYCVFRKEVVQIAADNLCDINGNISTLMEYIAAETLTGMQGVYFCTSAGAKPGNALGDAPLGEWP